jgi:hypothetical protein
VCSFLMVQEKKEWKTFVYKDRTHSSTRSDLRFSMYLNTFFAVNDVVMFFLEH